ncbi:MAG: SAM-dependent DNA methyltransferase [Rhodopirellula sp.]|nr:SAM-dependent DNA methyltransferase [Rhodopirellula sp.]
MNTERRKQSGAYYTPEAVVASLVRWATRSAGDRMLDPACGDGRFLVAHSNSVGVEHDGDAAAIVHARAPGCLIHEGDFFSWAAETRERFQCAAGNPPFIRYQRFTGEVRNRAIRLCARHGATFTSLTSSWAPFIVATATLLEPNGRMAFVVPAEIGHAPYAQPVLKYLARHFDLVQVIAVRQKLFPGLSEDCWLLYCAGWGGRTETIALSILDSFTFQESPPEPNVCVALQDWQRWGGRLRPFLLSSSLRSFYWEISESPQSHRFRELARVGIGYVTGANEFFHLRPSDAERLGVPERFLRACVRNGRCLTGRAITQATVDKWRRSDDPMLLLRLTNADPIPKAVRDYLDSAAGQQARETYKCRSRKPWYAVPDVTVPDAFLSYMSGETAALVANRAKCVATNSVHVVRLSGVWNLSELQDAWEQPFTELSCELEGHPLGGGVLKLEPREAGQVLLSRAKTLRHEMVAEVAEGLETMRRWRHYGQNARSLPMD